ncbi:MAG: pyridoxal phosphate-dependent aminotransferase [Pseudomonadota bacterium]
MTNQPSSPFDLMTSAFALNADQGRVWGRDFLPMSAGVNWAPPSPAIKRLLWRELTDDITTRNYGNPGGISQPVAALELVERGLHRSRKVRVTLTHGTTEAAWLLFEAWRRADAFGAGDRALTLGPAFPYYHRLAADAGLDFVQVVRPDDRTGASLPESAQIAEVLGAKAPRVIVLILPNNPLGEILDEAGLQVICDYVAQGHARLLVDRVCLMPWDNADRVARKIGPLVDTGFAGVVDSLSKSESLAGIRRGFAVTNAEVKARLVELTKTRFLNPPTFPAATMAAVRLAQYDLRRGNRMGILFADSADEIFSEYPGGEDFRAFLEEAVAILPEVRAGTARRHETLRRNFEALELAFADRLAGPLLWNAGFNVALATTDMDSAREASDAEALAREKGVGVLTSRCFGVEDRDFYFVRIGLTLPPSDFTEGLSRLLSFYASRRASRTRLAGQDIPQRKRSTS